MLMVMMFDVDDDACMMRLPSYGIWLDNSLFAASFPGCHIEFDDIVQDIYKLCGQLRASEWVTITKLASMRWSKCTIILWLVWRYWCLIIFLSELFSQQNNHIKGFKWRLATNKLFSFSETPNFRTPNKNSIQLYILASKLANLQSIEWKPIFIYRVVINLWCRFGIYPST